MISGEMVMYACILTPNLRGVAKYVALVTSDLT